jgi:transcription elongation factor
MSLDELRELNAQVVAAINKQLADEGRAVAESLSPGDRVWFDRDGDKTYGTVLRIGPKYISVEVEEMREDAKVAVKTWKVPAALVHRASLKRDKRELKKAARESKVERPPRKKLKRKHLPTRDAVDMDDDSSS